MLLLPSGPPPSPPPPGGTQVPAHGSRRPGRRPHAPIRVLSRALPNPPTRPGHAEEGPPGEAPMDRVGRRARPVDRAPPDAPCLPRPDPLQLNCSAAARRGAARPVRACRAQDVRMRDFRGRGPRTAACDSAGWAAHCGIGQGYLLVAFIENLASAVLPDPSAARHETVVAPHAMAEFGGGQHSACTSPSTRSTARGAV